VSTKTSVKIAVAIPENVGISQTPFNCQSGVRMNKKATGNTSVPKNDVVKERHGRSIAVKYDEKHISIQPVRYE